MAEVFQDHMPDNICFGCGTANPDGLHIRSAWEGDEAVCVWHSAPKYRGWHNVLNGGILATLIDCHAMGTAMAAAYQAEGRPLGSQPVYRYATGTITVRYLKPTPNDQPVVLRARVLALEGRKARIAVEVFSEGVKTAEGEVIGVRVLEGDQTKDEHFRSPDLAAPSDPPD